MTEVRVKGCRPIGAGLNIAIEGKLGILELRASSEVKFRALSNSREDEIASQFVIEHEAAQVDSRIDYGCFETSRTLRGKIHPALNRDSTPVQLWDLGEIEVCPIQVATERAR